MPRRRQQALHGLLDPRNSAHAQSVQKTTMVTTLLRISHEFVHERAVLSHCAMNTWKRYMAYEIIPSTTMVRLRMNERLPVMSAFARDTMSSAKSGTIAAPRIGAFSASSGNSGIPPAYAANVSTIARRTGIPFHAPRLTSTAATMPMTNSEILVTGQKYSSCEAKPGSAMDSGASSFAPKNTSAGHTNMPANSRRNVLVRIRSRQKKSSGNSR
ncbi:hypothetical protein GCM10029964_080910 [Kibdelosporangium lantanae]